MSNSTQTNDKASTDKNEILNRREDVNQKPHDADDAPSIDKSAQVRDDERLTNDRKYKPDIDGPQQASQETDDIYVDSRNEPELPPAGKKADKLSAFDLSKDGNK